MTVVHVHFTHLIHVPGGPCGRAELHSHGISAPTRSLAI